MALGIIATTLVCLIFLILSLCTLIYIFFKYSYTYWIKQRVPHIEPTFIYGSMKDSLQQKIFFGEEIKSWYKNYKAKGNRYFGIYLFHEPIFVPIDIELVKNILVRDFDHFVDRGIYYNEKHDPLSAHLFSLEGMKWKTLRQKLTPTFTSGKLKNMFQTLLDCTEELKTCLDSSVEMSEAIDIKRVLVQYTTDVIGSCAFGIECNSFKDPDSEFLKSRDKIFSPPFGERIRRVIAIVSPSFARKINMRLTDKQVDAFYRNLVEQTIEYREKNNVTRNDFMQLLIQLKNNYVDDVTEGKENTIKMKLTLNELIAQAFLFFIAGFETSSSAMTFCLYELARNQNIQDKARQDIINSLKKHDGKITYDSIMAMHYMERVIQETLRKHPSVTLLQRSVTQDYQVPHTNLLLKKGLSLFLPVAAIHMDPEFYPEPEKFDPERFTEENKASRPDYTFLPFGDGPRNCIGLRFGMMQVKVGLCRLLFNYKFTLNSKTQEPIVLDPETFARNAKGGIWLDAERIKS